MLQDTSAIDSYEIFLVDGYSDDKTAEIAKRHDISVYEERGSKGIAIRKAFQIARGEYILFIDADGSHKASNIPELFNTIKKNDGDLVIASRILGGSEELGLKNWDNFVRFVGNRLGTFIINFRWKSKLTDIQNGFRIMKRSTGIELNLREDSFAIEQEMVMKCLKKNKKIIEIPGFERKRMSGNSKICKRKEFWRYLWSILKEL